MIEERHKHFKVAKNESLARYIKKKVKDEMEPDRLWLWQRFVKGKKEEKQP